MSFIGIVTNLKNEAYMRKELSKYLKIENIIFITEKSINNIKNIKFKTILIDRDFQEKELLKKIISNSEQLIINADIESNFRILENLDLTVITYGFNSKSTVTMSSVEEEKAILCLQRSIIDINNNKKEPQEIEISINKNMQIHSVMGMFCLLLCYNKFRRNIHNIKYFTHMKIQKKIKK